MKYWYKFIAIIGVILTSCENKSTTTVSFPQRIVVENFPKNESLSEYPFNNNSFHNPVSGCPNFFMPG